MILLLITQHTPELVVLNGYPMKTFLIKMGTVVVTSVGVFSFSFEMYLGLDLQEK